MRSTADSNYSSDNPTWIRRELTNKQELFSFCFVFLNVDLLMMTQAQRAANAKALHC